MSQSVTEQPSVIYLKDYQTPAFLVESTALRFELEEEQALVRSQVQYTRNPDSADRLRPLILDGHESLELHRLSIDGEVLNEQDYRRQGEQLIISELPDSFVLECVTRIEPQNNTALEGLYKSDGMFCTQCEAEGFRRITFYQDRPDVMAVFETTVVADKQSYPVLLSNGNNVDSGEEDDGRHWVRWQDPFPKPAYLFALVAGNLEFIEDQYTTASGRDVVLRIFAEAKDLDKLDHAMLSLKRSMQWDEQVYGREYDLDIFMVVAVDFFNMGAMENKGLNIFNTSCVLAHPETTVDTGFQRVEGVVGHEYFHNWSGNRVTCRDWFQLSLKEGFTVFRDAEFSADMNSRTVKRIEDVTLLRTAQFAEDSGPMAHAVRPASFIEISNFYTLTVYEKGAEIVRMLHTLLGEHKFRQGSDLYFKRHDGQAVTTDDFVQAMADVSGRDMTRFKLWYSQAGTPRVAVSGEYDAASQRYTLHMRQSCSPTPEMETKQPFLIPVAMGLLDQHGRDITLASGNTTEVLELVSTEQSFVFENIPVEPVPSLLRGFSAPVKLSFPYDQEQLVFLMQHDSDGFNRWDAAQQLAVSILQKLITDYQQGSPLVLDNALIDAYRLVMSDVSLDKAMVAKVLSLPSEAYLSELSDEIDVDAIYQVRKFVRQTLAKALESEFLSLYQSNCSGDSYSPDAASVARRSLKNLALSYLMATERTEYLALARDQFAQADNMTDSQAALSLVAHSVHEQAADELLEQFYQRWQNESLVVNQWLAIQAANTREAGLQRVEKLLTHPAYDASNPNKIRSLVAVFCAQNLPNFHNLDGSGYRFLADQIIVLNKQNPQIASRLLTPLTRWKQYSEARQSLMKAELERIGNSGDLSKDVYEVLSKSLAQ
ncbi:aminopeptidase N [Amphritea balenae]|uniref:Aminopeptidase N n=1 Tax=Amphritea balenae TaxID=452629 RepID=A0A3P1SIK9_9GAMM|nr:aminopeptidase N [Amphritea balenae]RRC96876.1 aminopeptidase N [Amphritea balenae]GGK60937.1 aminopeptidase N [Amphritea balenae]